MHTALEEKRKDILPPGGKCLWSARKSKWVTELGTDRSGLPPGIIRSLRSMTAATNTEFPLPDTLGGIHQVLSVNISWMNKWTQPVLFFVNTLTDVEGEVIPFLSFRTASMRCWEDNSQMRRVLSSLTVAQMGRRGWAASPHTSPSMCPCGEETGQQLGVCVLARSLAASCSICSQVSSKQVQVRINTVRAPWSQNEYAFHLNLNLKLGWHDAKAFL